MSPFLIHRFAVPLPPGGRYGAAHLCKFQLIGLLGENGMRSFSNHPRRGYHIFYLISDISYLLLRFWGRFIWRLFHVHMDIILVDGVGVADLGEGLDVGQDLGGGGGLDAEVQGFAA